MSIPGFSAETSLYKTSQSYHGPRSRPAGDGGFHHRRSAERMRLRLPHGGEDSQKDMPLKLLRVRALRG